MRGLLGCGAAILMLVGAVLFARSWSQVSGWGVGTGTIPRQAAERGAGAVESVAKGVGTAASRLQQIARDPRRFKGQRATITGRVRSATKLASNRNLYVLVDGNERVLVIDDKPAPKPYYPRTVSGVVRTVASVGGKEYAYVVDVKSGVKVDPPSIGQVQKFFAELYEQVR